MAGNPWGGCALWWRGALLPRGGHMCDCGGRGGGHLLGQERSRCWGGPAIVPCPPVGGRPRGGCGGRGALGLYGQGGLGCGKLGVRGEPGVGGPGGPLGGSVSLHLGQGSGRRHITWATVLDAIRVTSHLLRRGTFPQLGHEAHVLLVHLVAAGGPPGPPGPPALPRRPLPGPPRLAVPRGVANTPTARRRWILGKTLTTITIL